MTISSIVESILIGLSSGMVSYLMVAGVSLIISGMGVVNFGQGAFYILGAYLCYTLTHALGFWWALFLTPIIVGLLGGIVEILVRPLFGKNMLYVLLMTMGIAYVLTDLLVVVWGYSLMAVPTPKSLGGWVSLFGIDFPSYYLFMMAVSGVVAFGFWIMFNKTRLGMLFRAIISDRDMVANLGVNVSLVFGIMFMVGVGLGGLAGALTAPISGFAPKEGLTVFGNVMPILMIGGMKSMKGTLWAALLVGLVNAFGAIFIPAMYSLLPFAAMVIVMLIKPEGIWGEKE